MQSITNGLTGERIHAMPLLQTLSFDAVDQIARRAHTVTLDRGEVLIERGKQLQGMYSVLAGHLKIYLLSCDGDERIVRLLQPGDSFGEVIMFNEIPSPVFVQALKDSSLAYFPKPCIVEALTRQPDFMQAMLRSMSGLMRALIGDLENCCLRNARQRLIHYLLRQANASDSPHLDIQLPSSKAAIASTLNLSAETFSRELHRLAHEGLIAINRRHISLLDKATLEKLVCEHVPVSPQVRAF